MEAVERIRQFVNLHEIIAVLSEGTQVAAGVLGEPCRPVAPQHQAHRLGGIGGGNLLDDAAEGFGRGGIVLLVFADEDARAPLRSRLYFIKVRRVVAVIDIDEHISAVQILGRTAFFYQFEVVFGVFAQAIVSCHIDQNRPRGRLGFWHVVGTGNGAHETERQDEKSINLCHGSVFFLGAKIRTSPGADKGFGEKFRAPGAVCGAFESILYGFYREFKSLKKWISNNGRSTLTSEKWIFNNGRSSSTSEKWIFNNGRSSLTSEKWISNL